MKNCIYSILYDINPQVYCKEEGQMSWIHWAWSASSVSGQMLNGFFTDTLSYLFIFSEPGFCLFVCFLRFILASFPEREIITGETLLPQNLHAIQRGQEGHVYWEPEVSCSNGFSFSASLASDNLTSRGLELLVADAHPCCSVATAEVTETSIYLYLLPEDRYLLGWPEAVKNTSPSTPPCPDFAQWAEQSWMRSMLKSHRHLWLAGKG